MYLKFAAALSVVSLGLFVSSRTSAQIGRPGAHPHYTVELGLAIVYETWDYPAWDIPEADEDDIEVDAVFLLGPRFIVGDAIAIPIRIGWPYLSVGVSFLV